jgi:hypothetical protein
MRLRKGAALTRGEIEIEGAAVLRGALEAHTPIAVLLGQRAGWGNVRDPVLDQAFLRLGREGATWRDLITREGLPSHFYEWLAERFQRRVPPPAKIDFGVTLRQIMN